MNKLFLVCGLVLMGIATTSQTENPTTDLNNQLTVENVSLTVNEHTLIWTTVNEEISAQGIGSIMTTLAPDNLSLNQISYLEEDEEIELDFDTKAYLPENFDPTTFYFNVATVVYMEATEDIDLGLDTTDYLPNDFDAYAQPKDVMDVSYMEETDYEVGFDTATFLPEAFDPYETALDLNTVVYLEEEMIFETFIDCLDF